MRPYAERDGYKTVQEPGKAGEALSYSWSGVRLLVHAALSVCGDELPQVTSVGLIP
jgi:hypothetical protein